MASAWAKPRIGQTMRAAGIGRWYSRCGRHQERHIGVAQRNIAQNIKNSMACNQHRASKKTMTAASAAVGMEDRGRRWRTNNKRNKPQPRSALKNLAPAGQHGGHQRSFRLHAHLRAGAAPRDGGTTSKPLSPRR